MIAVGQPAPAECPFCGGHDLGLTNYITVEGMGHAIFCRRCGAEGPHPRMNNRLASEEEAISAWNARGTRQ